MAFGDFPVLNLSQIIHSQIPDAEGNIIPSAVPVGSLKIAGSRADNQSLLVAIDAGIQFTKSRVRAELLSVHSQPTFDGILTLQAS